MHILIAFGVHVAYINGHLLLARTLLLYFYTLFRTVTFYSLLSAYFLSVEIKPYTLVYGLNNVPVYGTICGVILLYIGLPDYTCHEYTGGLGNIK